MSLGYKFYRNKWIQLCILTVGLGAFLWANANGEVKAEPGVVPLIVSIAAIGHAGLLILMLRAKKKEEKEKQAVFTAILTGSSTTIKAPYCDRPRKNYLPYE